MKKPKAKATKKKTNSKPKAKAKGAKPKQTELPGVGRKRDEELDSMILAVHRTTDKRLKLQAKENEMRAALLDKMKAKKKDAYDCYDGDKKYPCRVNAGAEKVKVTCEDA